MTSQKEKWIDTRSWMANFYWVGYKTRQLPLSFILTSLVSKEIMLKSYYVAMNFKEFLPIEQIPHEEKKKLVEECNATGLPFTNKTITDAARILYTLKKISA